MAARRGPTRRDVERSAPPTEEHARDELDKAQKDARCAQEEADRAIEAADRNNYDEAFRRLLRAKRHLPKHDRELNDDLWPNACDVSDWQADANFKGDTSWHERHNPVEMWARHATHSEPGDGWQMWMPAALDDAVSSAHMHPERDAQAAQDDAFMALDLSNRVLKCLKAGGDSSNERCGSWCVP